MGCAVSWKGQIIEASLGPLHQYLMRHILSEVSKSAAEYLVVVTFLGMIKYLLISTPHSVLIFVQGKRLLYSACFDNSFTVSN